MRVTNEGSAAAVITLYLVIFLQHLATLADRTDEAIASTMCRFNEAWSCWIITESFTDLPNDDLENGFTDEGPWPHNVEKFPFCDELARTSEQIAEYREGFGSELYCLRASPQALVGPIQAKGIEDYAFFVPHCIYQTLLEAYDRLMT